MLEKCDSPNGPLPKNLSKRKWLRTYMQNTFVEKNPASRQEQNLSVPEEWCQEAEFTQQDCHHSSKSTAKELKVKRKILDLFLCQMYG